jgi:hypothetical protein
MAVPVGATLAKLDATTSPDNGPLPFNHPLLCHPEAKPTCPGVPWRDLQFLSIPQHCTGKTAKWFFS